MDAIQIIEAGKKIGKTWIFQNVNAKFEKGKIYGLIGRNGAGKTMLLKSICGLTNITTGSIIVFGKKVGVDIDIPQSIGVIIEVPGFIPDMSGYANLKYLADLQNIIGKNEICDTLRSVGLSVDNKKPVRKYSLGMKQRLGIAQALMENPDLLLLDEPMNGLDSKGVEDMRRLFKQLREDGKTIILASHHKEDIENLCDFIYTMEDGYLCEGAKW